MKDAGHRAFDDAKDGFAVFDAEYRITYLDPEAERFFGATLSTLSGKNVFEEYPEIRGSCVEKCYANVLEHRTPCSCDYYHAKSRRWFRIRAYPLPSGGFAAHLLDTTSPKFTEEQFHRLNELYQAIVQASPVPIATLTRHGDVTVWNPAAEALFGWTADEVVGKPLPFIPEEKRAEHRALRERDLRGENLRSFEVTRVRKDGSPVHLSVSTAPLRDASGAIAGILSLYVDITQRKHAEEDRRALLEREREARTLAERLNRIGPLLLSELDPQRLAQKVTDVATELTGAEFGALFRNVTDERGESYTLYTLSGAPREAFAQLPTPRDTQVFGPTFRGEGIVRSDDITHDPRYGKNPPYYGMPEGHLPVRSYLAVPVISRFGDPVGGLFFGHSEPGKFSERHEQIVVGVAAQAAIAIDNAQLFSESRRVQDELQRSNDELRRANQDLEQFAYSASHDLQEPIRMVSVFTQMLKRKYANKLDATANQYIEHTLKGALRMQTLVADLLAYTRVTAALPPSVTPVNANEVLAQTLTTLAASIEARSAAITHGVLPAIPIHRVHLEQLFQNLIGNGIKYHGVEPPRIHVDATSDASGWTFSVSDNGIGIDPAYKEVIFGLFKRLHSKEEYEGTGIGLAICQRIVQRYGGRIWVESEAGKGSTFFFFIPVRGEVPVL